VPKSKKKKPGNGRRKQFETIFCIAEIVLFIFLWTLRTFFDATAVQILVVYFIVTIAVIVVLRTFYRRAVEYALDVLGKP
jgi:hypothetical protein